jgi:hypothetical protein
VAFGYNLTSLFVMLPTHNVCQRKYRSKYLFLQSLMSFFSSAMNTSKFNYLISRLIFLTEILLETKNHHVAFSCLRPEGVFS